MTDRNAAAEALMNVRRNRARIDRLAAGIAPESPEDGYSVQAVYREHLADVLGKQLGWKIGCTNERAQEHLGIDEPFFGGIFAKTTQPSPATFPASDFFMTVIEAEIGFRMKEPLPAAAAPYDPGSVADAVDCVFPCMEIVDSRYHEWTTIGAPHIIADNGSHGRLGAGRASRRLAGNRSGRAGRRAARQRRGRARRQRVRCHGESLNALTWLANVRAVYAGEGLEAGGVISTGTTIDVYDAKAGDELVADYGPLGEVRLKLT